MMEDKINVLSFADNNCGKYCSLNESYSICIYRLRFEVLSFFSVVKSEVSHGNNFKHYL